jgi:transposase-like protein
VVEQIDLMKEVQRLKEENRQLKIERDILKKATAYFAIHAL